MKLRPYQEEARDALWNHFSTKATNPAIVLPTGSGKSPLMAALVSDAHGWGSRTLIVAHRKELIEQTADKIRILAPDAVVGLYSAGLGVKDTQGDCIVAGIQSAYRNAAELGHFDLMMVDECQLLADEGMYKTLIDGLLKINPHMRIAGLTATPYRMDVGMICRPDGILHEICYEAKVKTLIQQGYLSPLISKTSSKEIDLDKVKVKGGEFDARELEKKVNESGVVSHAVNEVIALAADRRSVIVFAQGRAHAANIVDEFTKRGHQPGYIDGESLPFEREDVVERFKAGSIKFLVNIDVLTVGFDAPNIDCVAILRPTLSPGLFYQMVGRGFRLNTGKINCLVLDYGGNLLRHGPVDMITPDAKKPISKARVKVCPKCQSVCSQGYGKCPDCGFIFEKAEGSKREVTHEGQAANKGAVSGQKSQATYDIKEVWFNTHEKKDAPSDAPRSMKVQYFKGMDDTKPCAIQFVCFEHNGFARQKADAWWKIHCIDTSLICPVNTDEAVHLAKSGALRKCKQIEVEETAGKPFAEFLRYEFEEIEQPNPCVDEETGETLFCTWDETTDHPTPMMTFRQMQEMIWANNEPVIQLQINDGAGWRKAIEYGFTDAVPPVLEQNVLTCTECAGMKYLAGDIPCPSCNTVPSEDIPF